MKTPRRALAVLGAATLAALALALSGCVAKAPQSVDGDGGASRGTLHVGMTIAPSTIDPGSYCTFQDAVLTKALYVQLLQNGTQDGPNGSTEVDPTTVEPYFAKDYTVSEDGKTYDFVLNEGWEFPSGEPMNAEAVKYSLDRVNTIDGCPTAMVNDLYLDPLLIREVTAVSDYELRVELSQADGDFPLALATGAGSIVDPSVVEANGGVVEATPNEWMAANSAGSGPYVLEGYAPGVKAVLTRNETFGGEPAASDKIQVDWIKSDSSLLLQLQDGTLDVAIGLSKQSAKTLESDDTFDVIATSGTPNMQLLTPSDKAPWTDPKVREAVTHAIPYEDILDKVLMGYGELYYGPIQPTMPGYSEENSAPRTYDIDLAKQLIKESGLQTPVTVKLDIISGDAAQQSIATILQSSLKGIGIELEINTLSESAWGEAVYGFTTQAALRLDGPAVFSPGYYLQYDEFCESPHNTGRVCVLENGELLKQARATSDVEESNALWAEITKNWVTESPKAILYLDQDVVAMKAGMKYHANTIALDMNTWSK